MRSMDDVRAHRIEYALAEQRAHMHTNSWAAEHSSERDSQRCGVRTVNDISFITVSNVNTVNTEHWSRELPVEIQIQ